MRQVDIVSFGLLFAVGAVPSCDVGGLPDRTRIDNEWPRLDASAERPRDARDLGYPQPDMRVEMANRYPDTASDNPDIHYPEPDVARLVDMAIGDTPLPWPDTIPFSPDTIADTSRADSRMPDAAWPDTRMPDALLGASDTQRDTTLALPDTAFADAAVDGPGMVPDAGADAPRACDAAPDAAVAAEPDAEVDVNVSSPETDAVQGQSGTLAWAKRAGGMDDERPGDFTSLSDGSSFLAGGFSKTSTFGSGEANQTSLTSAGGLDIFLARYDADGSLSWARRAGGSGPTPYNSGEEALGVATLSDGSSVITGSMPSTSIFGSGELNQTTLTFMGGPEDIFVARYKPNGTLAWAKSAGGADYDRGVGIATSINDSVLVTGWFKGSATFGAGEPGQTVLTSVGNGTDIFVARYNSDGTLAWVKRAGGPTGAWNTGDGGVKIASLTDGSSLVTGMFEGSATFGLGEANQTLLTSTSGENVFVARYDTNGNLVWAKAVLGPGGNAPLIWGLKDLADGSLFVAGRFSGSWTFGPGELNQTTLMSAGGNDIFIVRYNSDGSLAWARRAGGAGDDGGTDWPPWVGLSVISDGSAYLTGGFPGSATFGPGEAGEKVLTSRGGYDVFVARYNPDGSLAWTRQYGGASDEYSRGIQVLSDGTVLLAGGFSGTLTLGTGEPHQTVLASEGGYDIFVARFNP